ncbi:MAG: penicillin acylase family protein [Chloroflexota bacterium]
MKLLRNILLILLAVVVILVATGAFIVRDRTHGVLPQHSGTVPVDGLKETVEVVRDARGVPHIYATNTHDLLFAQGYTQAQDRWWQMEFSRHTGHGRLSELVGLNEEIRGVDTFIRTVGWTRSAQRDIDAMDDETLSYLQAFADGVNAYIGGKAPADLALEYTVLGLTGVTFEIEPWTPLDTVVWGKVLSWDLSGNRGVELNRAALLDAGLSPEMLADFFPAFPYDAHPSILQADELPLMSDTERTRSTTAPPHIGETTLAGNVDPMQSIYFGHGIDIGSNNWVVSGELTESGLPLIAGDTHLSVNIPAVWYEVGLHCVEVNDDCPFNVVGFALPPIPMIIYGHNERVAWAVTNTGIDSQDNYLLRVNPENPLQYEWNGKMRDMTTYTEIIEFGDGSEPVEITVRETHLGPVINDNSYEDGELTGFNTENPMALRWTSIAETSTLLQSAVLLNTAQNWDDFREALRLWDGPSQNFLYADVDGNIGYQMPGNVPVRAADHDGFTPVPGWTDDYEWRGYVPFDLLPSTYNPERGYIASANQVTAPAGYYAALAEELDGDVNAFFQTNYAYAYRADRIHLMIEDNAPHSVNTFSKMQADTYSSHAADTVPFFTGLDYDDERLNAVRDWLAEWDYDYAAESAHALFFSYLWVELPRRALSDQLPEDRAYMVNGSGRNKWAVHMLMSDPDNIWWDDAETDVTETRDDILREAFAAALAAVEADHGADRAAWRWDNAHFVLHTHNPLGLSGVEFIEGVFNRGPYPTGGTDTVINNMRWRTNRGFGTTGAIVSQRMIIDLSDFDRSLSIIPTGQSGHPFSSQYDDQAERWIAVEYGPMHWTRDSIADGAVLRLEPVESSASPFIYDRF